MFKQCSSFCGRDDMFTMRDNNKVFDCRMLMKQNSVTSINRKCANKTLSCVPSLAHALDLVSS